MLSNKPYLIRAFYEWIIDCACTPYVLVNTAFPRCKVPQQFVENDEITFNIAPQAIRNLKITKDAFEFRATFAGVVHIVYIPIKAVLAVYAQENKQQGIVFDYEEANSSDYAEVPTSSATAITEKPRSAPKKRPPHLHLVK